MIFLGFLIISCVAAQRGHYIVDYQRLPLYQEFYLSPGLYRPLFPAKQEILHEARASPTDHDSVTINNQAVVQEEQNLKQQPPIHPAPISHPIQSAEQPEQQASESQLHSHMEQQIEQQIHQEPVQSVPVLTYSNSMTPDGSYSYKYETSDGLMREESSVMRAREDGQMVATVRGSYSYPGPDGRIIRVDYVADEGGFRATGEHLPSLTDTTYNFKYVVPS